MSCKHKNLKIWLLVGDAEQVFCGDCRRWIPILKTRVLLWQKKDKD